MAVDERSPFHRTDVAWGEGDAMSTLEAIMWRAEADAHLRSHGVLMELLDGTPDWDRVVKGHEWAVRRMPRLRQRVVEDPLRVGPPAWVGTQVDLSYHLRRMRLPDNATMDDVMDVASTVHMTPFDPARPLWEALLVEGLADGKSAFLIKLHHAYADGLAIVQLLDLLHSDKAAPTPDKPDLPSPVTEAVGSLDVLARNTRRGVARGLAGTVGAMRAGAGQGAQLVRDPLRKATRSAAFVRSLGRVTGAAPGTPSVLLGERGMSRRLAVIDVSMQQLRAGGKAAGGSVNDAYVAAIVGGIGRYHAQRGVEVGDIPFALPVSLRTADDAAGGNRFAGARIAAPAGERDPARRVALLRERMLAARDEPALDFMGVTAPVVSRIPTALLTRLTTSFTRSIDVQASNIRGLDRDAYIAGVRVERMFAFGPLPGSAMMATLMSHADRCCIGLTIDTAAVTDVDVFVRCLQEAFDEILALGPGASA